MAIVELILEIFVMLLSLVLIVSVALQKSKSEGITGVTASSESDNYFGKNKELAKDAKMAKVTKIGTIIFVVVAIVLSILYGIDQAKKDQEEAASSPEETAAVVQVVDIL